MVSSGHHSTLVCSLKFVLCLPQNTHHGGDLWLQYSVYIWVTKIMRITHYFAYVQQYCLHCNKMLFLKNCLGSFLARLIQLLDGLGKTRRFAQYAAIALTLDPFEILADCAVCTCTQSMWRYSIPWHDNIDTSSMITYRMFVNFVLNCFRYFGFQGDIVGCSVVFNW